MKSRTKIVVSIYEQGKGYTEEWVCDLIKTKQIKAVKISKWPSGQKTSKSL